MLKEIKGGLLPEKKDNRDFSFGKTFGTIDLSTIPDDFIVAEPKLKYNPNDFCTAFTTIGASEPQEGVELNPFWQFAVSKMISGNPEQWGQQLHPALKVHTKYGAIEEANAKEYGFDKLTIDQARYIESYPPELSEEAKAHKKKSYFKADGYGNTFDTLRATLWANRAKKRLVITGAILHDSWLNTPDGIVRKDGNPMVGDAFLIIGQKKIEGELYLVAFLYPPPSGEIGDKGKLYFPRDIVNKHFNFGGYLFVDMPVEEAKKIAWPWYQKLLAILKENWLAIKNMFEEGYDRT